MPAADVIPSPSMGESQSLPRVDPEVRVIGVERRRGFPHSVGEMSEGQRGHIQAQTLT